MYTFVHSTSGNLPREKALGLVDISSGQRGILVQGFRREPVQELCDRALVAELPKQREAVLVESACCRDPRRGSRHRP